MPKTLANGLHHNRSIDISEHDGCLRLRLIPIGFDKLPKQNKRRIVVAKNKCVAAFEHSTLTLTKLLDF